MNPYVRDGETHAQYLGDGVYAAFDGYQIWLRAERDGRMHEIAVESWVLDALWRYVVAFESGKTP